MSQKAHENRKDFKFFEKKSVEEICLMYGGRLFQARGAEMCISCLFCEQMNGYGYGYICTLATL